LFCGPILLVVLCFVGGELGAMTQASKTAADLEEEARQLQALRQSPVPLRKAKRWALLLVVGAAAQQVGWWSLYSDLGLWLGLLGGAAVLAGALGFDRGVAGHSVQPRGLAEAVWPLFLFFYAICGALATVLSAAGCPALGTASVGHCQCSGRTNNAGEGRDCSDIYAGEHWCYTEPGLCDDGARSGKVVDSEWSYLACYEGWGDRASGGCGAAAGVAGFFTLPVLLFLLGCVGVELEVMGQNPHAIVAPIVPSSPAVPRCTQPERQAHKQEGAGEALSNPVFGAPAAPQPIYQMNMETGALEQVTTEQADATDRTSRDAEARKSASKKQRAKKKKAEPVQTTSNPMMDMDFMDSSSEVED